MSKTLMDSNPPTVPVLPPDSSAEPRSSLPSSSSLSPSAPNTSAPAFAEFQENKSRRESLLSPLAEIFVGPEGLYSGARWLIYIVMGFVVLALLNTVISLAHPHRGGSVWWSMARELSLMLAAIVPGFVMARVEGTTFGEFGLPARGAFGRNFWAGALWGIAALTALLLVFGAVGDFSLGTIDLHGVRVVEFAFFYAVFFLITGLFEDFLMRGYSQWILSKAMNFWPAAALLSMIFGALHASNPGETKVGLAAVVAIGFFFCLTLRRTGTLWWAVGFHMAWDWGESFLYSVPDSGGVSRGHLLNSSLHGPDWLTGGSVGPEGSYLLFLLIAGLWILFAWAYPEVKYGREAGAEKS